MNKLDNYDLKFAVDRIPKKLLKLMTTKEWDNKIFIGGGFIRSIVSHETINDVDIFVPSVEIAEKLAFELVENKKDIYRTDNALTLKTKPLTIQIITRWLYNSAEEVSKSFDFTVCCAVIYYKDGKFHSYTNQRFYTDLASKRLVYTNPIRNEDAGGSMLRVLKYYQRGYRIPLNSLGDVITRLIRGIDLEKLHADDPSHMSKIITGLLREVDPNIDPYHISHLPSLNSDGDETLNDDFPTINN